MAMEYPSRQSSRINQPIAPYTSEGTDESHVWTSIHSDLNLARMTGANLMLVGSKQVVNLLSVLVTDQQSAVVIQRHEGLHLPASSAHVRTAVLRDVDTLTCQEQRCLLDWLTASSRHRMQVISTSSTPLLPLVKNGTFSDALYYRLNTVYIEL
jgi:transcriptional regulator of acetoin/glycerol metabolism